MIVNDTSPLGGWSSERFVRWHVPPQNDEVENTTKFGAFWSSMAIE